jgi:predicted MFS family arabinose efflux permease
MNSLLQDQSFEISRGLVLIMAIACGMSVANLYYCQPLLADIGRSFSVSANQIGFFVTLIQIGYTSGLFLVVPLGDKLNRRTLITSSLVLVGVALTITAAAPTITILYMAGLAMGITAIAPQLIIPYAAAIAPQNERGEIIGKVLTGLFIGILLARTIGGWIGGFYGWRTMHWIAAVLMFLLAFVMKRILPQDYTPKERISYLLLLRSLWSLLCTQPILREATIFGGMAFGAFSAFWVTLVFFLETPPYHYGSQIAGLLGLVGVGGALAANYTGKLADKGNPRQWSGLALTTMLVAFILMWTIGQWMPGLVLSVFLLDIGARMNMTLNQARIYNLNPELRNRLNSVYMLGYYSGGALGSWLGITIWTLAGWNGVCAMASCMIIFALLIYRFYSQKPNSLNGQ